MRAKLLEFQCTCGPTHLRWIGHADETRIEAGRPWELVALDDALEAFAKLDERKARVIELHYFGGFTQDEIATMCDVHVNTVARDLRIGEAWLRRQLRSEPPTG